MNILAISGSLRPASLSAALVRAAGKLVPANTHYFIFDRLGDLPHFSPEIDTETPPPAVAALRDALTAADIVLICTPEYAHGMPGSLKNLLDWTVSSGSFDAKPTIALSASPSADGGSYAHTWLLQVLQQVLGAQIPDACAFTIPFARSKVDTDTSEIRDPTVANALQAAFATAEKKGASAPHPNPGGNEGEGCLV